MSERLTILQGDCLDRLRERLDNRSVQCCVTSPPYGKLRDYKGNLIWDFPGIANQLFRVLCDGGVICWNVGDEVVDGSESLEPFKQAILFKEIGFRVHDTMIYQKLSFSHPESVRYHSVFEYVFILSKGAPRTFNPIKDKPNATAGRPALGVNTFSRPDGSRHVRATQGGVSADFGMRHNVWLGKTRGQEECCQHKAHPAMMPRWLVRDLILSWSNVGDTVIDPFGGSGTTGEEALKIGRKAILIEKEPEYVALIKQNCNAVTPGLPL